MQAFSPGAIVHFPGDPTDRGLVSVMWYGDGDEDGPHMSPIDPETGRLLDFDLDVPTDRHGPLCAVPVVH